MLQHVVLIFLVLHMWLTLISQTILMIMSIVSDERDELENLVWQLPSSMRAMHQWQGHYLN
jgi:hypothetical protein